MTLDEAFPTVAQLIRGRMEHCRRSCEEVVGHDGDSPYRGWGGRDGSGCSVPHAKVAGFKAECQAQENECRLALEVLASGIGASK